MGWMPRIVQSPGKRLVTLVTPQFSFRVLGLRSLLKDSPGYPTHYHQNTPHTQTIQSRASAGPWYLIGQTCST